MLVYHYLVLRFTGTSHKTIETTSIVEQYIEYLCRDVDDADPLEESRLWLLVKLEASYEEK
nr:hypothetical protein 3 [bacterium]